MFDKLHEAVVKAAQELRGVFDARDMNHMTLEIKVSGRVHDDNSIKIEYDLCSQYDGSVKGGNLDAVMDEYFRRRGWTERNAPRALAPPALTTDISDE